MKVKIGDRWYSSETDGPICVQFTAQDKVNINSMSPAATMYAVFQHDDGSTEEERLAWMDGAPGDELLVCPVSDGDLS